MSDLEVIERPDDFQVTVPPGETYAELQPFTIFTAQASIDRSVLLLLNTPINSINLPQLWNNTEFHICADGAANRLYDYTHANDNLNAADYIPQFIVGDCDSLDSDVEIYYKLQGTIVIRQETQYSTDFMKSVELIVLFYHSKDLEDKLLHHSETIDSHDGLDQLTREFGINNSSTEQQIQLYILGGIGGRFDQTVHSIHQLYKLKQGLPFLQCFFITSTDLIFLVPKGKTHIKYKSKSSFNSKDKVPICGLLPFQFDVIINSQGLKYDVVNWSSSISSQVSSSNGVSGTDGFLLDVSEDIVVNIVIDY